MFALMRVPVPTPQHKGTISPIGNMRRKTRTIRSRDVLPEPDRPLELFTRVSVESGRSVLEQRVIDRPSYQFALTVELELRLLFLSSEG